MLTAAELKEIEERANAATEGPWDACLGSGTCECTAIRQSDSIGEEVICDLVADWMLESNEVSPRKPANMEFLIHSRTDIPALLAHIQSLDSLLKQAEEALEFTLHAAEHLFKPDEPLQKGLCPMFYHTLAYEGDLELIEKTKRARDTLAKIRGER